MDNATNKSAAIRLLPAGSADRAELRRLLTAYLRELAALQATTPALDPDGHIPYRHFDSYWQEPERIPFLIKLDNTTIGFCLLRDAGTRWHIAEFYIAPPYRRSGAGTQAVSLIKTYCRQSGRHRCLEARTHSYNPRALAFWRSQGFVTVSGEDGEQENVFDLSQEASPTQFPG